MGVELIDIDSQVLGRNVLAITDLHEEADLAALEDRYVAESDPFYVYCKVPIEECADIHRLEQQGFELAECQLKCSLALRRRFPDVSPAYTFELVTEEDDLPAILDIARETFTHDRWSCDPAIGPEFAGLRYRQYVLRSFQAEDEAVYRLCSAETGETLAFKTHRYLGEAEVLFLLGGVDPRYKGLGLGVANEYCELNALIDREVKRGYTHFPTGNYPVINLELGQLGFRLMQAYAVLRKIYGALPGR